MSGGLWRGSSFRVRLPLVAAASEGRERDERTPRVETLPSLTGLRVMVVDDVPEAREFFSTHLR